MPIQRAGLALMRLWPLLKCAVGHWVADRSATTGAALAFYCAFSLAPLLIILLSFAAWVVGEQAAYGQLREQLTSLFGPATARVLLNAMEHAQDAEGLMATAVSVFSLVLGATTVFAALDDALETIWGSRALVRGGVWGWIRVRLLSFGMILAVGFLLLVSLSISAALTALRSAIAARYTEFVVLTSALDLVLSLGLVTLLIAVIYRYMPARRLAWRPILWGALVTALLFNGGRWAIGLYLSRATQPSAFGAAASFAAMLLWLYYSAQIFLFGAEVTACLGGVRREDEPKTAAGRAARSRKEQDEG